MPGSVSVDALQRKEAEESACGKLHDPALKITKNVSGRNDLVLNVRMRNVQVQNVRRRNILGAKRPGPKCQGAKHPGPECQGVKCSGPKCQGTKRPVQKVRGRNVLVRNVWIWKVRMRKYFLSLHFMIVKLPLWLWHSLRLLYDCEVLYYYHLNLIYDSLIGLT